MKNFNKKISKLLTVGFISATIPTTLIAAESCPTGGCNGGQIGISDSDSNSLYNDQILSPNVTQAATNVNNYVAGNSVSSINGISCANDTLSLTGGLSQSEFGNNQYSDNYTVGVIYSISLGESNNTCQQTQKLVKLKMQREMDSEVIKNCIGLYKAVKEGFLSLDFVLSQPLCKKVLKDTTKGYHGEEYQRIVKENKHLKNQLKKIVDFRK